MIKALKNARNGDLLGFDRGPLSKHAGSGHEAVFASFDGTDVCYFSSQYSGTSRNCEPLAEISDLSLSRFPSDVASIPEKLASAANDKQISFMLAKDDRPQER